MSRRTIAVVAAALVIGAVIAVSASSEILVDWLWFRSLGYGAVFATAWTARVTTLAVVAIASWLVLAGNGLLAARATGPTVRRLRLVRSAEDPVGLPATLEISLERVPWRGIVLGVATVLSIAIGLGYAAGWADLLKWWHAVPFERRDPVFGRDLSFYVFTLPVYDAACGWAFATIVLSALLAAAVYWARGAIELGHGPPRLPAAPARHLAALLAGFFLVKAADYLLQRYGLLLSNNGVVFGAAYTDVHVRLPLLLALAAVSVLAALLCAATIVRRDVRLPIAAVVLVLGAALIEWLLPAFVQSYRVKPDELRLESPYIADNIALTRFGFGLDDVAAKEFPANGRLTPAVLAANQTTIQNLRWWDPRPLLDTYRQLQEIRLYYDFRDVDVDRYTVEGTYRQVMLAARELDQERLPADAQTWINQHFKFTHGIGLAMSPVNRFDTEGLPIFFVQDIPPVSSVGLPIERPGIYFGEQTASYVIVGAGTKEFDYPKGQENVYTTYQGADGVGLDSLARRALFAWWLGDIKLLISSNISSSSRILFRRRIADRIRRIAPFLILDRDPYLVISDGRLVWLQDAYTVSDALPYSQQAGTARINYIRNSVKIAVDAYDGTVHFYIADADDPIVRTYERIFPSLFEPLERLSPSLRQHLRYPEDLFVLQAGVYGTYHMTDPEVFYNKEDLWSIPEESHSGRSARMDPYYTIMRLPGEAQEEFILMLPMVPNRRDNMIAWLAARCDGAEYGSVIEFRFPKDKLIYGPAQIEARIDQDTAISQQLSLWNQTGSRVIRGNLLVIPIDDALLYVEPLYLSAENRQLPELKRLIASYGDRVGMHQQVEPLLASLFAHEENAPPVVGGEARPAEEGAGAQPAGGAAAGTTREALEHYRRALEELRRSDWQAFGREMDALKNALEAAAGEAPSATR
jgi:uncharacterized membrane protein (UPF0182 family)